MKLRNVLLFSAFCFSIIVAVIYIKNLPVAPALFCFVMASLSGMACGGCLFSNHKQPAFEAMDARSRYEVLWFEYEEGPSAMISMFVRRTDGTAEPISVYARFEPTSTDDESPTAEVGELVYWTPDHLDDQGNYGGKHLIFIHEDEVRKAYPCFD